MLNNLLAAVKTMFHEDRPRFYLIASRLAIYLLTYLTLLLPFLVISASGNSSYFALGDLGFFGTLFGLLWWATILLYFYYELTKPAKVKTVMISQLVISVLLYLILLLNYSNGVVEASNYSNVDLKIGISFIFIPIFFALSILVNLKPGIIMPFIFKLLPKTPPITENDPATAEVTPE
ncbi:MAG: hypothetical protein AB7U79_06050 [Candidatus Izemoplasmatales bacterium]